MKIQNTGKIKAQQLTRGKKSRTDGTFQSLLNAEMTHGESENSADEKQNHPEPQQNTAILEEAVQALDQTLQQIEAGSVPDAEVIDTIQQLRSRLKAQNVTNTAELREADTLLAVEAARIKSFKT